MARLGQLACSVEGPQQYLLIAYCRLVQIDLPIHESTSGQEILDGVDAFCLDYQTVVADVEHFDDTGGADVAFGDTCEEGVAAQIVQTVHVQLAGDELMENLVGVFVLENADGQIQASL